MPAVISAIATIICLLFRSGPTAVFRRVVTVIIFSIYRIMLSWLFPHICKEIFEAMKPALVYCNAASTVFWIVFILWIQAAHLHTDPRIVFSSSCHVMRPSRTHSLQSIAAARNDLPDLDMTPMNALLFSAFTRADNLSMLRCAEIADAEKSQSPDLLTKQRSNRFIPHCSIIG